jgi:hypothetical protein
MRPDPTRSHWNGTPRATLLLLSQLVLLLVVLSCGQTEMIQTWTNPEPPGEGYGRVLVVGVFASQGDRRIFETEFVQRFQEAKLDAVPSYSAMCADPLTLDNVRATVKRDGFETVFLVETLSIEQSTTSWITGGQSSKPIPREDQLSLGSSYHGAEQRVNDPNTSSVTTIATIQCSIYHVATEDLLWRGTSRTYDPGPAGKVVPPLSHMVVRSVQRAHLY